MQEKCCQEWYVEKKQSWAPPARSICVPLINLWNPPRKEAGGQASGAREWGRSTGAGLGLCLVLARSGWGKERLEAASWNTQEAEEVSHLPLALTKGGTGPGFESEPRLDSLVLQDSEVPSQWPSKS